MLKHLLAMSQSALLIFMASEAGQTKVLISYKGGPLNLDYLHWIPIKVD